MNEKVNVLLIGNETDLPVLSDTSRMEITVRAPGSIGAYFEEDRSVPDVTLILRVPSDQDAEALYLILQAHTLLAAEDVRADTEALRFLYRSKCVRTFLRTDLDTVIRSLPLRYRNGQYGEKMYLRNATIEAENLHTVRHEGNTALYLGGTFGEAFSPLLTFHATLPAEKDHALDFWPEFEVTKGDVRLTMTVRIIQRGSADRIADTVVYPLNETSEPLTVIPKEDGYLSVSYQACGEGSVRLSALHVRQSRLDAGVFLPGGMRFADERRQEFFAYFDPMDLRPPLNVYFSGYREAEGFEGYFMMHSFGAPFLLISDPRIEGGAYYLGSKAYEDALVQRIRKTLEELSFDETQVVFSGLSMGTYGACYHGARFQPHALVIGKPLLNGGAIAQNARTIRPDDFGTSLDVMRLITGECDDAHAAVFDERMMQRLREADFTKTSIAIAYMRHDDYDRTAYADLVRLFGKRCARIYGKGIDGRHNDNSPAIKAWFISQYQRILAEDFGREMR